MAQTARWACITRMTQEQLETLHSVEKNHAAKHKNAYLHSGPFRIGERAGMVYMNQINDELGSFWPARTPEDHKAAEMKRFEKAIYKIWGPLEKSWVAGGIESEMEYVHRADYLIHKLRFTFRSYSESSSQAITKKWDKKEPKKYGVENAVKDD